eukprot:7889230-Pyramimonas_sp.AAC.1
MARSMRSSLSSEVQRQVNASQALTLKEVKLSRATATPGWPPWEHFFSCSRTGPTDSRLHSLGTLPLRAGTPPTPG